MAYWAVQDDVKLHPDTQFHVLSGGHGGHTSHGDPFYDPAVMGDIKLYNQDVKHIGKFPNTRIYDTTKLSFQELENVLHQPQGTVTYCAWCFSGQLRVAGEGVGRYVLTRGQNTQYKVRRWQP